MLLKLVDFFVALFRAFQHGFDPDTEGAGFSPRCAEAILTFNAAGELKDAWFFCWLKDSENTGNALQANDRIRVLVSNELAEICVEAA